MVGVNVPKLKINLDKNLNSPQLKKYIPINNHKEVE